MRFAIVVDNVVHNAIEAESEEFANVIAAQVGGIAVASATASPQDEYTGGEFVRPLRLTPVPLVVTKRQAHQALILTGRYDDVVSAIGAIADPMARALMQSEFHDSQTFERERPALLAMAQQLQLDDEQLDDLFRLAATL